MLRREIRRANQRSFFALVGSALVVGALIILGLDGYGPAMIGRAPAVTWVLAAVGGLLLVAAWPRSSDD